MAYTGPYSDLDKCLHCNKRRYNVKGKARQTYRYIPLIPRLRALHANPKTAEKLRYRAHGHQPQPGKVTDVFDSTHYHNLRRTKVTHNGKELPFKFFEDSRDIALGLSTDGFTPFKKGKQTTWPLIAFIYDFDPEIRFQLRNILSLGVIPGPKKPKDSDSFLFPFVQELIELLFGVVAYDALTKSLFLMHAYLILVFGDIPAVSMLMRMKGHNGTCPCRLCSIIAVCGPNSKTLYVPHDRRNLATDTEYDITNLPLRTHDELIAQAREVQEARNDATANRLSQQYGIKGVPLLSTISSLSFPISFPYDFMHLIWENLIPNLVLLWTGQFKDLESDEGYYLMPSVWDAIGEACAASGRTIPSAFGKAVPDIAKEKWKFTAETWSFWALHLAPSLLRGRFQNARYHQHFVELVKLLNICLQFEISHDEIETIRVGMIKWVEDYEK